MFPFNQNPFGMTRSLFNMHNNLNVLFLFIYIYIYIYDFFIFGYAFQKKQVPNGSISDSFHCMGWQNDKYTDVNGLHRRKGKERNSHSLIFKIPDLHKLLEVKFLNNEQ